MELADEKNAQENLISMLCGCCLHLAVDGDTISRSTPLFDGLMEQETKGSRLADHLPKGEDEHARLRGAFTRAMKGPVTLPVTLLSKGELKHQVDIFIVRRGEFDSRGKRTSFGFLVGIRTGQCHSEPLIQNTELLEACKVLGCETKEEGGIPPSFLHDAPSTSADTLSACGLGGGIDSWPPNGKTEQAMYVSRHGLLLEPTLTALIAAKNTFNWQRRRTISAPPSFSRHKVFSGDNASIQSFSAGKHTDWSESSRQLCLRETCMTSLQHSGVAATLGGVLCDQPQSDTVPCGALGLHSELEPWGSSVSAEQRQETNTLVVASGLVKQGEETDSSSESEQSDSSAASTASCRLAAATIVKVGSQTLRELLQLKSDGVGSVGSLHGEDERCAPCSFHFTHIHAPSKRPPCKASYLCEYCHDVSHNSYRCSLRKCRRPYNIADGKVS